MRGRRGTQAQRPGGARQRPAGGRFAGQGARTLKLGRKIRPLTRIDFVRAGGLKFLSARRRGRLRHLEDHAAIDEQPHLIDVDDLAATSELVLEQPMQLRLQGLDQLLLLQQQLVQGGYVSGQRCSDWHVLILTKPACVVIAQAH
jgi:hypothetical protein